MDIFFCCLQVQWKPAITKCHGTAKFVRYSGIFVIAKTPLQRTTISLTAKILVISGFVSTYFAVILPGFLMFFVFRYVTQILKFFLTFGRNKRQIVDVVPTNTIVLSISISMGGYVSTNMTTRARQENMSTLYTAKPVFLESFGCKQWTFLVSQDKNTPNVNTIPFKQQINITQVFGELQVQLLIKSSSITSSSSSRI